MAAYRQIQTISNTIPRLAHHERDLDWYVLFANVFARPTKENEYRTVLLGTDLDEAAFVDREIRRMTATMPLDFEDVRQLVLCEDQGPQCTAMAGLTRDDQEKNNLVQVGSVASRCPRH